MLKMIALNPRKKYQQTLDAFWRLFEDSRFLLLE